MDMRSRDSDVLSTSQLEYIFKKCKVTQPYFKGVYALDELPGHIDERPAFVVSNTAYKRSKGEHWVCFFMQGDKVMFFDSYGLPPKSGHFYRFIESNTTDQYEYNQSSLQGLQSEACGKFVATYVFYRCLGYTHDAYVQLFENKSPDGHVRKLFAKIFGNDCRYCNNVGQTCCSML